MQKGEHGRHVGWIRVGHDDRADVVVGEQDESEVVVHRQVGLLPAVQIDLNAFSFQPEV